MAARVERTAVRGSVNSEDACRRQLPGGLPGRRASSVATFVAVERRQADENPRLRPASGLVFAPSATGRVRRWRRFGAGGQSGGLSRGARRWRLGGGELAGGALLPDVQVNAPGDRFLFFVGERRPKTSMFHAQTLFQPRAFTRWSAKVFWTSRSSLLMSVKAMVSAQFVGHGGDELEGPLNLELRKIHPAQHRLQLRSDLLL